MLPIDILLNGVVMCEPHYFTDSEEPPSVYQEGVLEIGSVKLHVCVLSDGRRLIDADDMQPFIDSLKV